MNRLHHRVLAAALAAALTAGSFCTASAGEIENQAAVAGMAVTLNNYYASSYTPEADILEYLIPTVNVPAQTEQTESVSVQ